MLHTHQGSLQAQRLSCGLKALDHFPSLLSSSLSPLGSSRELSALCDLHKHLQFKLCFSGTCPKPELGQNKEEEDSETALKIKALLLEPNYQTIHGEGVIHGEGKQLCLFLLLN